MGLCSSSPTKNTKIVYHSPVQIDVEDSIVYEDYGSTPTNEDFKGTMEMCDSSLHRY